MVAEKEREREIEIYYNFGSAATFRQQNPSII